MSDSKAKDYIAQAEKKLQGGFLSSVFGSGSKTDEAIGLYEKAANAYKVGQNWQCAGDAFNKAAKLNIDTKNSTGAASNLVDAANCYKKVNKTEFANTMTKAIELYTDMGRFTIAAKQHMSLAEEFEKSNLEAAISHYERAADFYRGEESNSSANKCVGKVAHLCAQMGEYQKAADLFEQLGRSGMENKLLQYGAKEYFFKATVCHLCIDIINGKKALAAYEDMYPSFADSRECKLLKKLLEALQEENGDEYSNALREYDSISRLEPWLTTLFLQIKKSACGEMDLT